MTQMDMMSADISRKILHIMYSASSAFYFWLLSSYEKYKVFRAFRVA